MGNNRHQKPAPPQYEPKAGKKKPEEVVLDFKPCCVCQKQITEGYYARVGDSGTCNKTCWKAYQANKPSLIDYVIPTKEN